MVVKYKDKSKNKIFVENSTGKINVSEGSRVAKIETSYQCRITKKKNEKI
jgi:hypothetical protein